MHHSQKHPAGLWYLSASYSLLVFAYIAINTLLVLYATHTLNLGTTKAYALYAAYNALIFTSPLAGGFIADKFGHKRSAVIGLLFSMLGSIVISLHITMFFYYGIALFIVGYGLCTPAFFCLVGLLYTKDDARRDSGYTIFYLIFNLGSFSATVLSGYISNFLSYSAAFAIAAVGLLLSIIILLFVNKKIIAHPEREAVVSFKLSHFQAFLGLLFIGFLISPFMLPLLNHPVVNQILIWTLVAGACLGVIWLATKQIHKLASARLIVFMILTIISGFFWSLYMLEASLMTVFAEHNVNRHVLGQVIPPSVFYSLDPLGVIIFGIILGLLWNYLGKYNRNPSLPAKFSASLVAMGAGYVVFAIGTSLTGSTHLVNPLWIVFGYIFLTLGEMLISPIGLSMVGRLAPVGKEGVLMGVWTLFMGVGAVLSGYLADMITIGGEEATAPAVTNPYYLHYFAILGGSAILLGLLLTLFVPRLRRLIRE